MIGGAPMLGRRYGNKEIAKVYVGDERIWPPIQIPQLIGSLIYVNATTGVFPPHQAGDILVVIAVSAGATPPSLPAGFISAYTSPATDFSMAVRVGWAYAYTTNTSNGTWTGAVWITASVYRNADTLFPFGPIASLATPSNTVGRAPAITPTVPGGASAVLTNFVNNGSGGSFNLDAQPVGWLPKVRNARIVFNQRIDTRTILPTKETLVAGGSVNWRGTTFEVVPPQGLQHLGTWSTSGAVGSTIAPHQPGDLIVVIAQRQNTTVQFSPATPPPVVGQTYPVWIDAYDSNVSSVQGANMATKVAYGIATTSSHDTGTFTNATWTTTMVFRNVNQSDPIGDVAGLLYNLQPAGPILSPALNMQDKSGRSLHVVTMHESQTNASSYFTPSPPDGWARLLRGTHRLFSYSQDRKSGAACTETTTATNTSWRTVAFEVKAAGSAMEEPLYLYDVEVTYLPNYEVSFRALKGFMPVDLSDEAFMFRCAEMPRDGYVGREFTKQWAANGYGTLNCTLEDLYGDGTADATLKKKISFQITPRP